MKLPVGVNRAEVRWRWARSARASAKWHLVQSARHREANEHGPEAEIYDAACGRAHVWDHPNLTATNLRRYARAQFAVADRPVGSTCPRCVRTIADHGRMALARGPHNRYVRRFRQLFTVAPGAVDPAERAVAAALVAGTIVFRRITA